MRDVNKFSLAPCICSFSTTTTLRRRSEGITMSEPRGRYFPQPFRIDGAHRSTPGIAGLSTASDAASEDGSSSRRGLFSSELPPPSIHERFNEDGTENVEWARYQSTLRLKSKWDSIYERYKDAHLMEQDEIYLAPADERTQSTAVKRKRLSKTQGKRKRRRASNQPFSDSSSQEWDDDSSFSDRSSASEYEAGQIRIVRDCGILRNLAGTLHFGTFIKEEELDALETVNFPDSEDGGSEDHASALDDGREILQSKKPDESASSVQKRRETCDDLAEDSDSLCESEIEMGSDEDEIGGWGETGFIRAQYPEFAAGAQATATWTAAGASVEDGASEDLPAPLPKHDPDLDEFLLAEKRRKAFCAAHGIDDDAESEADSDSFDAECIHGPEQPDLGQQPVLVIDSPEDDVDDEMDLLSSPRQRRTHHMKMSKPHIRPQALASSTVSSTSSASPRQMSEKPSRSATELREDAINPSSDTADPSSSSSSRTVEYLPTFESSQYTKRGAVDNVIARWTLEQEEYIRLDEDAQYLFDLGIPRQGALDQPAQPSVLTDPFDSLPPSFHDIPDLKEMLVEGNWAERE
ncbi:hypothetical protein V8E36_002771 [Tilletia maclaganii]